MKSRSRQEATEVDSVVSETVSSLEQVTDKLQLVRVTKNKHRGVS